MKYVYILRSVRHPRQKYVGVTADLSQRLSYHNTGRCSHTSKFMPWEMIHTEPYENEADAFKRERQIKGWTSAKKDALILGDWKMLKELAQRRVS